MKQLFFALFLSPFLTSAQTSIAKIGCSEYRSFVQTSDGRIGMFVWDQMAGGSHMQYFNLQGCMDVSGGLYQGCAIDGQGYAYTLDNKKLSATKVTTDASGKAFSDNVSIYGYFSTNFTIRKDGSIWTWGGNDYKFFSSTPATPTKLTYPAGLIFTKLACGATLLGLTNKGEVYEWTSGNVNPIKKNLPSPASDIFSSANRWSGALVNGDLYGWTDNVGTGIYLGKSGVISTPVSLKTLWGFSGTISKVTANHNALHFLADDGDLYGLGDNAEGDVGNGEEKVNHAESYSTPYVWDWKLTGGPMITKPVHIAQGIKFKDIFAGSSYAFYHFAIDTKGNVYSWGRNKSMVLMDGRSSNNDDAYPNSLDVLAPKMVTPLTTINKGVTFVPYTLSAKDQNINGSSGTIVISGMPSTWYSIANWNWSQISGPSTAKLSQGSSSCQASGLVAGTYVFRVQMVDNNGATISTNINVTVVIQNSSPIARIAAPDSLTLPADSLVLDGSSSSDPDGIIASYVWSQISGPPATIDEPMAPRCGVHGLQPGTCVFQLIITDNQGATAKATVSVLVKARPVIVHVETAFTATGMQVVIIYSDGHTFTLQ